MSPSRAGLAAGNQGGELTCQRFRGGFVGQVQGQAAKRGGHGAGRVVKTVEGARMFAQL